MSYPTGDPNQPNPNPNPNPGPGNYGGGSHSAEPHPQSQPFQQSYPGYPNEPYGPADPQAGFYTGAPQKRPSFLGSLFDLGFTQLVTLRVIPVLYTISLIVISLGAVIYFFVSLIAGISAVSDGDDYGVLLILVAVVVVPLVWLIYVVLTRVIYEFFLSIVRIADNTDPRHRRP